MKNFSFLACVAMILTFFACGPKETRTPFPGTDNFFLYSVANTPNKFGVKDIEGKRIMLNIYDEISFINNHFITRLGNEYQLVSEQNVKLMQSNAKITYNVKLQAFESKNKDVISFYFPKEKSQLSGKFESYTLDANGNILVKQGGKYGVYAKSGKLLVPINNEMLLLDGEKYVALNSKNAKQPMLKDGKITYWSRVKITAFDKDGKEAKAPTQAQAKKLVK